MAELPKPRLRDERWSAAELHCRDQPTPRIRRRSARASDAHPVVALAQSAQSRDQPRPDTEGTEHTEHTENPNSEREQTNCSRCLQFCGFCVFCVLCVQQLSVQG